MSSTADKHWLGADLGGTKILVGLFDPAGNVVGRVKSPTGAEGGGVAVVARIVAAVEEVLAAAKVPHDAIGGMALGIPGQIEPASRVVRFAPNLEWRDFDVRAHLPGGWPWPTFLENDVRMGTYGEYARGAAQGAKHVLGIFAGTGVGGGLILNGELYTGFLGNGGEIGHTVLHWRKGQTLETLAGRKYLMRRAAEQLADAPKAVRKNWKGIDPAAVKSSRLAELYTKDDPIALGIVDDAARAIGATVGGMINFLSPEVVVIGGGLAGALGEAFVERVREIAAKFTLPGAAEGVRIAPAALGDDSGIVGCAAYAARMGEKAG